MGWACDAVHSYAERVLSACACEVSCRVRAREAARPVLHPRGCNSGFTPGSRIRLPLRYRWTGGSPASIHGVVVVLPSRMELGAKGKEGQPHWGGLACGRT